MRGSLVKEGESKSIGRTGSPTHSRCGRLVAGGSLISCDARAFEVRFLHLGPCRCSSTGRVLRCQRRGCRFDPDHLLCMVHEGEVVEPPVCETGESRFKSDHAPCVLPPRSSPEWMPRCQRGDHGFESRRRRGKSRLVSDPTKRGKRRVPWMSRKRVKP